MKIIIFGATGFLGKNFFNHNLKNDHLILSPTRQDLDLFDKQKLSEYIKTNQPDLIINCAGKVGGIAANINNNLQFLNENLLINSNVILSSYENKVKKLINFGSSCMYPSNIDNPMDESQIINGNFEKTNEGFALSKVVALKLCDYITNNGKGYLYKTIIPCNMFGKFDHYRDSKRSHMVAAAIQKVNEAKTNNASQILVWGSGKVRREYTNAFNIVDFVYKNLNNFENFPNYFNLGANIDYTVKEYYEIIMEIFEFKAKLIFDKSKPDGVFQKLMNTNYPMKLNWKQPFDLKNGLKETINFYKKYAK